MCYYYGVSEKKMETDGSLLKNIRNQVKAASQQDGTPCSYSIHSTSYEDDVAYVARWSSQIQVYPDVE